MSKCWKPKASALPGVGCQTLSATAAKKGLSLKFKGFQTVQKSLTLQLTMQHQTETSLQYGQSLPACALSAEGLWETATVALIPAVNALMHNRWPCERISLGHVCQLKKNA